MSDNIGGFKVGGQCIGWSWVGLYREVRQQPLLYPSTEILTSIAGAVLTMVVFLG
jgi:hypothetical protein